MSENISQESLLTENNDGEADRDLVLATSNLPENKTPQAIIDLFVPADTKERAEAISTLLSSKVPKYAIRQHEGRGGEIFSYVDHVWVTRLMRNAFGPMWSFDTLEANIEEDGTASAISRVTVKIMVPGLPAGSKPEWFEMTCTEGGSCNINKGMTLADRKLSAISKSLVRCVFRMFGVGEEFYKTVDLKSKTSDECWQSIMSQVNKYKEYITEQDVIDFCKENGISSDKLNEHFSTVWSFISLTVKVRRAKKGQ